MDNRESFEKLVALSEGLDSDSAYNQFWIDLLSKFDEINPQSYNDIKISSNFYVDIIGLVLKNELFNKNLLRALEEERNFLESKEAWDLKPRERLEYLTRIAFTSKRFLHLSLLVAFAPIAVFLPLLNKKNLSFIKRVILSNIFYIQKYQNWTFSVGRIVNMLEDSIFRIRFDFHESTVPESYRDFRNKNRLVAALLLLESSRIASLGDLFKKIDDEKALKGVSVFRLKTISDMISVYSTKRRNIAESISRIYGEKEGALWTDFFSNLSNKNEDNILGFLGIFASKYQSKEREANILGGLAYAPAKAVELLELGKSSLRAFSGEVSDEYAEWSNKIYLICQKTLGAFSAIKDAQDTNWKIKVFYREIFDWFSEVYGIINKFELEDDWREVEKLTTEENDQIEWKASFISPVEVDESMPKDKILEIGKKLLEENIIRTMIAMMNTKGGVILVGLIEHPERMRREEFIRNTLSKNGFKFFDIAFDLKFSNLNLDGLKLLIQDKLKKLTGLSEDYFNDLWSLTPLSIKKDAKPIEVYKLVINKSSLPIYHVEDATWISLAKRANAKTIFTDPREALKDLP